MSIGVHRVREQGLRTGLDEHAGLQAFRTREQDRHLGRSIQISNNWKLIYPFINRHRCASCSAQTHLAVAGHSPATNTSNTQLILLEIHTSSWSSLELAHENMAEMDCWQSFLDMLNVRSQATANLQLENKRSCAAQTHTSVPLLGVRSISAAVPGVQGIPLNAEKKRLVSSQTHVPTCFLH